MCIRIHKAVGWGLTHDQLIANSDLDLTNNDAEELWEKLTDTTNLVMPSLRGKDLFPNGSGMASEADLLALDIARVGVAKPRAKTANDLMQSVFVEPTGFALHLFWPNMRWKNSMYRSDNTIDWVESNIGDDGELRPDGPSDWIKIIELKNNPYPWEHQWMDATGKNIWGDYWTRRHKSDLAPLVPIEIRWWLTYTGIVKNDAWQLLRPYYVSWWSYACRIQIH